MLGVRDRTARLSDVDTGRQSPSVDPRVSYAPILDSERGVAAGYLAASGGQRTLQHGDVAEALAARAQLPPNTFLSLALRRTVLTSPTVRSALLRPADLTGVVIDVTGTSSTPGKTQPDEVLAEIRAAGGLVAVHADDVRNEGFAVWERARAAMVVLDPSWTYGIADNRRAADTVRALGELANRQDAWLLSVGVARAQDFDALVQLGVPLISGHFVGSAYGTWPTLAPSLYGALKAQRPREHGPLRALVRPRPTAMTVDDAVAQVAAAERGELISVAVVDDTGRPWAVAWRGDQGEARSSTDLLRVNIDTAPREVVARACARRTEARRDPVILIDSAGRLLSVLEIEKLSRLAYELDAPISTMNPETTWTTITDRRPIASDD